LDDLAFWWSFAALDLDVVADLACAVFDIGVASEAFAGSVVESGPGCVDLALIEERVMRFVDGGLDGDSVVLRLLGSMLTD
jgi:hypothetical protein